MFRPGSCDIGFLCSNMRIEANNASSKMELKNQDFETQVENHEEISECEEVVEKLTTLALIWNSKFKILQLRSRDMKKLTNLRR